MDYGVRMADWCEQVYLTGDEDAVIYQGCVEIRWVGNVSAPAPIVTVVGVVEEW